MKNSIKLLSIGVMLFLTSFSVKAQDSKSYYYYAYAVGYDNTDKVYVTTLKTITIDEDTYFPISEAGLSNQFRDYMEAEYETNGIKDISGKKYFFGYFDEAKATEYYRGTLKRYDEIVKIYDFKYLPKKR
jgi:hypothetical protein